MGHQHPPAASQARTRRIVNYSTKKSLLAIEGRYHVLVYLHFIYPSRSVYPRVPVYINKSDVRGQKKKHVYTYKIPIKMYPNTKLLFHNFWHWLIRVRYQLYITNPAPLQWISSNTWQCWPNRSVGMLAEPRNEERSNASDPPGMSRSFSAATFCHHSSAIQCYHPSTMMTSSCHMWTLNTVWV